MHSVLNTARNTRRKICAPCCSGHWFFFMQFVCSGVLFISLKSISGSESLIWLDVIMATVSAVLTGTMIISAMMGISRQYQLLKARTRSVGSTKFALCDTKGESLQTTEYGGTAHQLASSAEQMREGSVVWMRFLITLTVTVLLANLLLPTVCLALSKLSGEHESVQFLISFPVATPLKYLSSAFALFKEWGQSLQGGWDSLMESLWQMLHALKETVAFGMKQLLSKLWNETSTLLLSRRAALTDPTSSDATSAALTSDMHSYGEKALALAGTLGTNGSTLVMNELSALSSMALLSLAQPLTEYLKPITLNLLKIVMSEESALKVTSLLGSSLSLAYQICQQIILQLFRLSKWTVALLGGLYTEMRLLFLNSLNDTAPSSNAPSSQFVIVLRPLVSSMKALISHIVPQSFLQSLCFIILPLRPFFVDLNLFLFSIVRNFLQYNLDKFYKFSEHIQNSYLLLSLISIGFIRRINRHNTRKFASYFGVSPSLLLISSTLTVYCAAFWFNDPIFWILRRYIEQPAILQTRRQNTGSIASALGDLHPFVHMESFQVAAVFVTLIGLKFSGVSKRTGITDENAMDYASIQPHGLDQMDFSDSEEQEDETASDQDSVLSCDRSQTIDTDDHSCSVGHSNSSQNRRQSVALGNRREPFEDQGHFCAEQTTWKEYSCDQGPTNQSYGERMRYQNDNNRQSLNERHLRVRAPETYEHQIVSGEIPMNNSMNNEQSHRNREPNVYAGADGHRVYPGDPECDSHTSSSDSDDQSQVSEDSGRSNRAGKGCNDDENCGFPNSRRSSVNISPSRPLPEALAEPLADPLADPKDRDALYTNLHDRMVHRHVEGSVHRSALEFRKTELARPALKASQRHRRSISGACWDQKGSSQESASRNPDSNLDAENKIDCTLEGRQPGKPLDDVPGNSMSASNGYDESTRSKTKRQKTSLSIGRSDRVISHHENRQQITESLLKSRLPRHSCPSNQSV